MKAFLIALVLFLAGTAEAQQIICRGNIYSTQGEGIVARRYRFEVGDLSGNDIMAVLQQCKEIARQRQARAARKNPGGNFRSLSDVELTCTRGNERFEVRRVLQTTP